jgi:hypothetical protein
VNADWFYSVGDSRLGPVTEDELKRLVADGKLKPGDLVWRDGMADWVEARTVESLFPKAEQPRRAAEDSKGGGALRQRLDSAFDGDRPSRRGQDEDDRPSRRGRRDDEDEDRPSRRRRDDVDDEDDRPRVRRDFQDDRGDDYDDRPRRRKNVKPGAVQAVGIMLLVGSILGLITMASVVLGSVFLCCLWPGIYFEIVWAILAMIRGINMLNQDDQGPPKTLCILQIIMIVNGDVINCILGIVSLVMISNEDVVDYYRKKGFY